jgi:hypothetical protein
MPTPENFELPRLKEETRDKRLANLKFGPGHGRRRGSVNKANRDLKNGLLTAAINLGRDGKGAGGLVGYCEFLGALHPKAFSMLLGKLLPMNLNANIATASISDVRIVSVPTDHYVTSPGNGTGMPVIEHIPPSELPPAPIQEFAASSQHETKLIAALERLSVETLEQLAASIGDQG